MLWILPIGLAIGTFIGFHMMNQGFLAGLIGAILAFLVGLLFVNVGKKRSNY